MKIKILTIFPQMFDSVLSASILGRAREQGLLDVQCIDIRPFSDRKHKNTDDYPFGGGAGMAMMAQPILAAMASVTGEGFHGRRIYLWTPRNPPDHRQGPGTGPGGGAGAAVRPL